jgi:RNA polymerase sigma-54 factor
MKSRQRITVTTSQRLQLTLGLQASIRVLKADAAGLTQYLAEQAAENPALQLAPPPKGDWLPRWDAMFRTGAAAGMVEAEAAAPSLMAHVEAAIASMGLSRREGRIALLLAEGLEPSGWLGANLSAVAAEAGCSLAEVDAVLARVQRMEPAGLFARSLAECLRLQALAEGDVDEVLLAVIGRLDLVAQNDVARLARSIGVPEPRIRQAIDAIRQMDPKPGAGFDTLAAPVREPDLITRKGDEGWTVELNRSSLPTVSVSAGRGAGQGAARAVLRLVEARNATLLRVGQEILRRQEAALERGAVALVPMTMDDVASAVGLHESTVSRVVAGTSVDTPRGTIWLRQLFSARMGGEDAPGLSAAGVRARLGALVAREDKARPLSDAALADLLSAEGAEIARRTVAKYREALGIGAAHRRRRV